MLRSRVTSGIDMVRLGNALARPGIDPRIWVSYAILLDEPEMDTRNGTQGVYVPVQLLPSGNTDWARVSAAYAGNGFGLYMPLHKDDEVLVLAPSGDPDEGLVVGQRLWSTSDPPPSEVAAAPNDVTLVVEPGRNLRMAVKGAGDVYLTSVDGKVFLGEDAASRGVARLDDTTVNGTFKLTAEAVPPVPPAPPGVIIMLQYFAPGNAGVIPDAVTSVTLAVATLVSALGSIDVTGKIDSASDKVVSA